MTATTPATAEDEWWQDGRNVSLLASWYKQDVIDHYNHERPRERWSYDATAVACTLVGIYERPWDFTFLRDEYVARLAEAAEKLVVQ